MMKWEKVKLFSLVEKPISGEWGTGEGSIKVIRSTNFTNDGILDLSDVVSREIPLTKVEKKKLIHGDIIIEKSGGSPTQPVGRVVHFLEKVDLYLCNNFTSVLRPKNHVNARFLFWSLFSGHINGSTLKYQNKTTGIINLQLERYCNELEVPLPPLHIQKQIADTLDKADALRRKDQELIQKYDELAQAIFYDMFGDPVRNEKGWKIKKLGSLSNHISSGSTPLGGQKVYMTTGVLFIRSQNVLMRSFDISDAVFIDEATHKKMKRTWVKHNDVLLNITGASIGRIAVYEGEDDCANVNQHVCIIRPLKNVINPYFLMFMMSTDIFQNNIIGKSAGGTRESFTFEQIKQFDIIAPPIELQTRYNEFVQKISNQLNLASECSVETDKTFQAIMSEFFS